MNPYFPPFCTPGSHGGGHPDETETPLIAWGAGVSGPKSSETLTPENSVFDGLMRASNRRDVSQADIAPLMVWCPFVCACVLRARVCVCLCVYVPVCVYVNVYV